MKKYLEMMWMIPTWIGQVLFYLKFIEVGVIFITVGLLMFPPFHYLIKNKISKQKTNLNKIPEITK